ncbi:MAG: tetratricopeptide repeat protein [Candidatus Accumulibacter sp.]|jgi:tetratricopeptide (TPR) repeat protein|nr:tetratricopeptide repeat protein [Accumulibacter sp.]
MKSLTLSLFLRAGRRGLACLAALVLFPCFIHAGEVAASPGSKPPAREVRPDRPPTDDAVSKAVAEADPGQAVFELLLAEIALRRNEVDLAVQAYTSLAQRTRDPKVMERAIEVAGFARRHDAALDIARLWLDTEPDSPSALRMLASVLVMGNRLGEAAPHLIRLLESDKAALPGNLLSLNRMFMRHPDRAAVFRLIDTVCQPFFGIAEAHYAVAAAASGAGMNERARREAGLALELRPDWERAALLQTQFLMRESREDAIAFMKDFLGRNPEAGELRLLFARVLIGERRYADAKREFDRLLRDAPDNPDLIQAVALLALQSDDRAFAEEKLEHLVTLEVRDKSAAYFYLGQIAEEDGRIDEAMSRYAQVVSGERYPAAKTRQARLLFLQGKIDEGRALLRGARTDSSEDRVQLQIAEAALLREAGLVREAFDFLEQRLADDPERPDLLYESSLLAERLNLLDLMENRLRRLIELRPDDPQAYNALGYAFADRNERLPEARRLIEKALAMAPDDAAILDSMGWVLFRQGDLPGALAYLERSWDQREDPEIGAHLGEVLWRMGRRDEAQRLLEDVQKKFPSNAVLSETVRRLVP